MNVKVAELRAIADRLFTHLEETGRHEFEISEDYYWVIPKEELYEPAKDPEDLTIGQLSDDWNELNEILTEESPPIGYGLVWLSAVLKVIGEKSAY